MGKDFWLLIVRTIILATIDKYWMDHLTAIESLREGINLRGYAQLDPLVEYKNEAFSMFEKLIADINFEVTRRLFKIEAEAPQEISLLKEQSMIFQHAAGINPFIQESDNSKVDSFIKTPPIGVSHKKPGRNDPCWCGSGKKYKKCCYPRYG